MHLAGWNFTIYEEGPERATMNVIDVMASDFFQAKASALQHYRPGSTVADFRPLSEEELQGSIFESGGTRKWIPSIRLITLRQLNVEMVNFTPK